MAKSVESLEENTELDSKISAKGPPAASPKPRSASDSSLYSTAGKAGSESGMAGLGSEGNSPALIGMQGLALTQRGLQMLNLAFPDNPGLLAVLADITGRLQSLIPQLVSQSSNGMAGGMMGQMMQQQPPPGMPMGGLPPTPPMGGAAPLPTGGPPPMMPPM